MSFPVDPRANIIRYYLEWILAIFALVIFFLFMRRSKAKGDVIWKSFAILMLFPLGLTSLNCEKASVLIIILSHFSKLYWAPLWNGSALFVLGRGSDVSKVFRIKMN